MSGLSIGAPKNGQTANGPKADRIFNGTGARNKEATANLDLESIAALANLKKARSAMDYRVSA